MPIYEYRCATCGHQEEFIQKVSAAPLTRCPKCGAETFTKMVTAAGFHLKGSGWYATDFKNRGAPPAAKTDDGAAKKDDGAAKKDAAAARKDDSAKPAGEAPKGDSKPEGPKKDASPPAACS
jgi:putative FmdB family regulatory protein